MKTILLISFILPLLVFGQPIDYNNFDSKTAEKVLFEKLLYYRDTVKTFASGIKIAEYSKNIKNYKENSKWNWSEDAYKFFSRPNCNKICSDNRVYHVDVENLVFSQKQYLNDWLGTNNGIPLPKASYLYMIDADGDGTIDYQGWVFITR